MRLSPCALSLALLSLVSACATPSAVDDTPRPPPSVQDRSVLIEKARMLQREGNLDGCIELYSAAHAVDPSDLELLGEILNILIPAERWVDAVAAYDRALTAHPRNPTLLMARGRIQRTTGRPIGAYESYRRASELSPESVDAHMQLGLVLIELELWSESIAALAGAISGDPDNYQAHHLMGDALMRIGEYERAIPVLARAQTLAPPGSVDDSSYRALAYLQLARPEDALALIDRLLQAAPTNMELHYRRGLALRDLELFDLARMAFVYVLELQPANSAARRALETLEREPAVGPAVAARATEAQTHYLRGEKALNAGELISAFENFRRAIALDQSNTDSYLQLGRTFLELELFTEAAESFRSAIVIDPTHYGAHSRLGSTLLQLGRYELAIPVFARAEKLSPTDSTVDASMRGMAYIELGRNQDAVSIFQRLVSEDGNRASLHYYHGVALRALGRSDEARAAFARAVSLDPGHAPSLDALHGLAQSQSPVRRGG